MLSWWSYLVVWMCPYLYFQIDHCGSLYSWRNRYFDTQWSLHNYCFQSTLWHNPHSRGIDLNTENWYHCQPNNLCSNRRRTLNLQIQNIRFSIFWLKDSLYYSSQEMISRYMSTICQKSEDVDRYYFTGYSFIPVIFNIRMLSLWSYVLLWM